MRTLEELETFVEKEAKNDGFAALAGLEAQKVRFRLARELAEARKAHNLTQSELAKRSGVPQSVISKIEAGAANATEITLVRVLHPLGCTLAIVPAKTKSHRQIRVGRRRRTR